MRQFYLQRDEDESGVSGTGKVAVGVVLPTGRCVMEWHGEKYVHSIGIYQNIDEIVTIHGHNGKTKIVWGM